jgi:amino acid permease
MSIFVGRFVFGFVGRFVFGDLTAKYPQTPIINQRPNQDRALFFAVSE